MDMGFHRRDQFYAPRPRGGPPGAGAGLDWHTLLARLNAAQAIAQAAIGPVADGGQQGAFDSDAARLLAGFDGAPGGRPGQVNSAQRINPITLADRKSRGPMEEAMPDPSMPVAAKPGRED